MNPLARTLRAYAADARAAFRSAPVEVALGVALAVALSVEVRSEAFSGHDFRRVAGCVALAFPLVFALSVLAARQVIGPVARWAGTVAVLAACAVFGWLGLGEDLAGAWWRWQLLVFAAVLLLAMTPGIPWRTRDRRASWAFAWRLAVRVVGIGLYAVALFGVLAGAVAAVVSLFELGKPDHLYTDLAGVVFFAFAPWIFVGGIHRLFALPPDGVPEGVSRLGRWLYAPVLVIYLTVLYAYAVKVLATGDLPRNLVSPLVIAAGLIGLVGAVLLEPVHDDDGHRGVSLLVRAIPALLLPLVPLALWALGVRLKEYGWTEFRYARLAAVVAIGILAVAGTVRLIRRQRPLQGTVPAVFAVVLLLSAVGPWSAPAVSRRDQTERLRTEFRHAGIDPRRLPEDTVMVDSAIFERISSGARYLVNAHGVGALRAVVPSAPDTVRDVWQMAERLGLRQACEPGAWLVSTLSWGRGIPVVAGTMVPLNVIESAPGRAIVSGVRATLADDRLRLDGPGWSAEADLVPLRRRAEVHPEACGPKRTADYVDHYGPAEARVEVRDPSGVVRAEVIVTRYSVGAPEPRSTTQQPGVHVREVDGFLVLR